MNRVSISRWHPRPAAAAIALAALACGTCTVAAISSGPFISTASAAPTNEPCPNAHVRQQTSSAGLLDCRAYELASAANSGGYDVESNLLEGQTPFAGYPQAPGRVLYGVQGGGIPGTGDPTDRGVDPYLAVRGEGGWSTEYVGIPANVNSQSPPFSSTLAEADPTLDTFAFAGPELCAPCFTKKGAVETGIPLHLPGGELIQGMSGSLKPESASTPDGYIARYFSADGEHFLFGSTSRFAEGGNEGSGDVSIYDRNLATGKTHVVSNASENTEDFPEPLPCLQGAGKCSSAGKDPNGIAELAVSADGSHVLVAQKVSEDKDHNVYWHLYMDINDSVKSIDLTPGVIAAPGGPGFKEGVLFDGMSEGGSKVFFTTKDKLLLEDEDESPDIYEAEVSGSSATLRLVSTGEAGPANSDACEPVANSGGEHWNLLGTEKNCGAVAIGGGAGVAVGDGSIYFLSPENLTGAASCGIPCSGEAPIPNQPNLYLAAPGKAPRFLATLEPNNPLVLDSVREAGVRHAADFQLSPSGRFAAFPSTLALAGHGEEPAGHTVLYRYDASAEVLACASCTLGGEPSASDSSMAQNGLSLTEGGQLFFTTTASLLTSDTDEKRDIYEWEPAGTGDCEESSPSYNPPSSSCLALISAGTSSFDSGLLSATADSTDVFFFTRDSLVPQDTNGPTMKIYDARALGGFPYTLPEKQCQASDECHGPSSPAPGPLEIGTLEGAEGNVPPGPPKCRKGFIRRHGRCLPKHPHKLKRSHHRRGGRR